MPPLCRARPKLVLGLLGFLPSWRRYRVGMIAVVPRFVGRFKNCSWADVFLWICRFKQLKLLRVYEACGLFSGRPAAAIFKAGLTYSGFSCGGWQFSRVSGGYGCKCQFRPLFLSGFSSEINFAAGLLTKHTACYGFHKTKACRTQNCIQRSNLKPAKILTSYFKLSFKTEAHSLRRV